MIRIVAICGSRIKNGNTEALVEEALSRTARPGQVRTELIALADKKISGCVHCNWCVRNQTEGRFCAQQDDMSQIYPQLLDADGILLASPAHFGRLSGQLADAIDRMRVFVHGNLYRGALKDKVGGALAVAFLRGGGIETTLTSIDIFFLTVQMIVATSGRYQLGAGAYSSREGRGRFEKDPRHMVLEDDYGTESASLLVDRMLELAQLVQAGRKALDGRGTTQGP